jgi:hypothetical protein
MNHGNAVWQRTSKSDEKNGQVHYRGAAAKLSLPRGLVVCVAHYHEGDEGTPEYSLVMVVPCGAYS